MRILLVRHGKPKTSQNTLLNSAGFANWVKHYNHSLVCDSSRPTPDLQEECNGFYIASSNLQRAIDSSLLTTGKQPDYVSTLLREMDIPRYKLPFTLRAWTWVYLNRFLWMLGLKGRFESYVEAKKRAALAAKELTGLALQHKNVVVFAHGYINLHIRQVLRRRGWKQLEKSNDYWGVSVLEIDSNNLRASI